MKRSTKHILILAAVGVGAWLLMRKRSGLSGLGVYCPQGWEVENCNHCCPGRPCTKKKACRSVCAGTNAKWRAANCGGTASVAGQPSIGAVTTYLNGALALLREATQKYSTTPFDPSGAANQPLSAYGTQVALIDPATGTTPDWWYDEIGAATSIMEAIKWYRTLRTVSARKPNVNMSPYLLALSLELQKVKSIAKFGITSAVPTLPTLSEPYASMVASCAAKCTNGTIGYWARDLLPDGRGGWECRGGTGGERPMVCSQYWDFTTKSWQITGRM